MLLGHNHYVSAHELRRKTNEKSKWLTKFEFILTKCKCGPNVVIFFLPINDLERGYIVQVCLKERITRYAQEHNSNKEKWPNIMIT
jgi:hypothetical protein